MKKVLFTIVALVLAIGLALPMAIPVAAAPPPNGSWVLYGTIGGQYLVTIDEMTGDATLVTTLVGDYSVYRLAFDSTNGVLYGLATMGAAHTPYLVKINIATGNVTPVGQITRSGGPVYFAEGLAINPTGTIYVAMSINGDYPPDYYSETLATVDSATAVATPIGTITPTVQNEADGIEFVGSTLYAADDPGAGPTNIYTIDTSTCAATLKGTLSSPRFNNVGDMAYNPDSNLLYGFDPGANSGPYPRYLCTISQPETAVASPIGVTHTSGEFDGKLLQGIAWVYIALGEVSPSLDYNPVGTEHTVTVQVWPAQAGITVNFVVEGDNPQTGEDDTDGSGVATFNYTGNNSGEDTIWAFIDLNGNDTWDPDEPKSTGDPSIKYWFGGNFVTGGGNIKGGRKVAWTFGGNVGFLTDWTIVGQFEIVDHANKVSWHCHDAFDSLIFWGDATDSPPASVDHAQFIGTFTSNKGGSKYLRVTIWDDQEPGRDFDWITVEVSTDGGATWTTWFSGNPISGGNFQIHEGFKGPGVTVL
jgi:hypothetical protein